MCITTETNIVRQTYFKNYISLESWNNVSQFEILTKINYQTWLTKGLIKSEEPIEYYNK